MTQTIRQGVPNQTKHSKLPWLIWLVVILALVAWYILFQSRWFLIEQVQITGLKRLSTQKVLTAAQVRVGQPLMAANPNALEARIGELPAVKRVVIERGWPHTLIIRVTERKPIAAVPVGGAYVLVDDEGHVAGGAKNLPAKKVLVHAKPETLAIKAALNVYQALPSRWKVLSVHAKTRDSVKVQLQNGIWIIFGSDELIDRKSLVANALLAKGYRTINVSAPETPTAKR